MTTTLTMLHLESMRVTQDKQMCFDEAAKRHETQPLPVKQGRLALMLDSAQARHFRFTVPREVEGRQ
jgi:hypothetical protein